MLSQRYVVVPRVVELYRELFGKQRVLVTSAFGWRASDGLFHHGLDLNFFSADNKRVRGKVLLSKKKIKAFDAFLAKDGQAGFMITAWYQFNSEWFFIRLLHLSGFYETVDYIICIEGGDPTFITRGYSKGTHLHFEIWNAEQAFALASNSLLSVNGVTKMTWLY
jgi:hypothetical protein